MTAHDHREFVEGCYRCELNRDEALDDATSYAAPMICAAHGLSIDNCQGDCCEFMPPEDAVREALGAEVERLREVVKRLHTAIYDAMETMNVTDMELGPGGVARKAYADLYGVYFSLDSQIWTACRLGSTGEGRS